MKTSALALAVLALAACQTIDPLLPPPPEELDLWADAAAGVEDPELARLCREAWELELRADPFRATFLGDPRYHGDVPDLGLEARHARRARAQALLERVDAAARRPLAPEDRLTAELLHQQLADGIALSALDLDDWVVDPIEGPPVRMLDVASIQPAASARQREQVLERWSGFASYLNQCTRNLQRGRLARHVAARPSIEKSLRQIEELLAQSPFEGPLVAIADGGGRWVELGPEGNLASLAHEHLGDAREQEVLLRVNKHLLEPERCGPGTRVLLPSPGDTLTLDERGAFMYEVIVRVQDDIRPALQRYHDVLEGLLLDARDDDHPGLSSLPGGAGVYRALMHAHTSLPEDECDAQAIHDFGLAEVRRIRGEIAALGQKVFGTSDVGAIQARLRNDPALHFRTREEVLETARASLARARAAQRKAFGRLPAEACEVVPVPAYDEEDTTIAFYREPAADGSRPGRYYVNTYAPETRPRYEAEVLAFHEAVPGHHLQIALAQEREDLPRFRRHSGCTAFCEGWALYSERLCDELGLYSGDLDRLGMLSYDAWRACRLVVDTGLHAFGWSRDQAIDYLLENTLLARNNCETEVDRYIAWPGQALAYKIGQREILALREEARTRQGKAFSLAAFHDRLLENGAVTLESLRTLMSGSGPAIEAGSPAR